MRKRVLRLAGHYAPPTLLVAALIVAWHWVTVWFDISPIILPAPLAVLEAGIRFRDLLPEQILVTVTETILGLVVSLAIAVPLAILVVWAPLLRRTIYPVILAGQSVPKVALAPLFLIWIGYGIVSKVLIAASIAFFPIMVNTVAGLSLVEPDLLDMVRVLRASTLQTFLKIRIPTAMPHFFSGTKVAVTLAVIGSVVGEFVGADKGLGYLMMAAGSQMNTAMVFVALVILSLTGVILFGLVELVQRLTCPWSTGE
ncbi:MAG TPA: ABC transporter permease [Alphaproteobacteria bacterium]|nr:ABC transporter permease [Alphaproteobacteria bacterium]